MLLFEFGLQLPGHNDFTINDGFHQQPPAQTGDFVLFLWSTILYMELWAAPCRQKHLSAVRKEIFLQLMNSSFPYMLISSQWPMKRWKESKLLHWEYPWLKEVSTVLALAQVLRMDILCIPFCFLVSKWTPYYFIKSSDVLLLPCPRVSCVIKDTDRLAKQSLVMFSVYKALAITRYADKEWESLIS